MDGLDQKFHIEALIVDSLNSSEVMVDGQTIIDWGFLPKNWPIQLIKSAVSGTGKEKVIENKIPSFRTCSLLSLGFIASQMASVTAAIYCMATSHKYRKF